MKIYLYILHYINYFRDEYIKKRYRSLSQAFSVNTHLTVRERFVLYQLARDANVIAEIGSYFGASACCFGAASLDFGPKTIICIDTWNNETMEEGFCNTFDNFKENTKCFASYIVMVRGFSERVLSQVKVITSHVDLLFIDGDHSYDAVKADWNSYKSFLNPGSVVVFHDVGWADGVVRVIEEEVRPFIKQEGRLPNMWWGKICSNPS